MKKQKTDSIGFFGGPVLPTIDRDCLARALVGMVLIVARDTCLHPGERIIGVGFYDANGCLHMVQDAQDAPR